MLVRDLCTIKAIKPLIITTLRLTCTCDKRLHGQCISKYSKSMTASVVQFKVKDINCVIKARPSPSPPRKHQHHCYHVGMWRKMVATVPVNMAAGGTERRSASPAGCGDQACLVVEVLFIAAASASSRKNELLDGRRDTFHADTFVRRPTHAQTPGPSSLGPR